MSFNMTGALITMMGRFLSTLNQSAMIQNNLLCTERTTNLSMIKNQAEAQTAEGMAQAMNAMASGIGSIVGGMAAVGGGVAGVVGSAGEFADLSSVGTADNSVVLEQQGAETFTGTQLDEVEENAVAMDVYSSNVNEEDLVPPQNQTDPVQEPLNADGVGPVLPREEGQPVSSEADKQREIERIKAKWGRLTNAGSIGQGLSGLAQGLGQALGYSFTTRAAEAQAAATKLGGLAQSVSSMMSSTESNYQSTMSLNVQLANSEFQSLTSWWLASSKA